MTESEVVALLEENQDPRGMANWAKMKTGDFRSFGIGLTQLRKLAKKVGRDHDLSQILWKSSIYDARVIGILIDEPKKITVAQAEMQVEETAGLMFAHIYCSCNAPLSKSPIVKDLAFDWMDSSNDLRRKAGFLLLAELAKKKLRKNEANDDALYLPIIARIEKELQQEVNAVKSAMNNALLSIGQRSPVLNTACINTAKSIGKVDVDYGDNSCEAPDVHKHLAGDRIQAKIKKMM